MNEAIKRNAVSDLNSWHFSMYHSSSDLEQLDICMSLHWNRDGDHWCKHGTKNKSDSPCYTGQIFKFYKDLMHDDITCSKPGLFL